MSRYQIRNTDKALTDMAAIYEYIAENLLAPETALKQYDRIAAGIESLDEFPNRCQLFESQPEHQMVQIRTPTPKGYSRWVTGSDLYFS